MTKNVEKYLFLNFQTPSGCKLNCLLEGIKYEQKQALPWDYNPKIHWQDDLIMCRFILILGNHFPTTA